MAEPKAQKERLDLTDLQELEMLAKQVESMPDGAEKAAQKKDLQEFFNFVNSQRDLPAEPMALESIPVALLDYLPGLVRTAAGEAALTATGKNTLAGAAERIKDAAVPDFVPFLGRATEAANRPAPSAGEYRKLMGGDTEFLRTKIRGEPGFDSEGKPIKRSFDPTYGDVPDFFLNASLDPSIIRGVLKKGAAKGATQAMTAEEAKKKLREALDKKYGEGWAKRAGKGAANLAVDPAGQLGEMLYRSRFKQADAAAKAAERKAVSDVMLEAGAPGFTSTGIKESIDDIIGKKEANISAIEAPAGATSIRRSRSDVLEPIYSSEVERKIGTPGTTDAYLAARNDILDEFRAAARQNPALMAQLEEVRAAAGKRATGPGGELLYEGAPTKTTFPGTPREWTSSSYSLEPTSGVAPGVGVTKGPGGERVVYPQNREYTTLQNKMRETKTVEPGRPITQLEGTPAVNPPAGDILQFAEEYYTPQQLRDIARNYQQKAKSSGYYSQPSKFDPKTRANLKAIEENMALGKMQNDIGMRARDLEMAALDEALPGAGGQVFQEYKDISSLMTGAPYLDRPYLAGGSPSGYSLPRYLYFRNPILGAIAEGAQGTADLSKVTVGKALMSRPVRYGVMPAARAGISENYSEKKRNNPWSTMRKIQRGE